MQNACPSRENDGRQGWINLDRAGHGWGDAVTDVEMARQTAILPNDQNVGSSETVSPSKSVREVQRYEYRGKSGLA